MTPNHPWKALSFALLCLALASPALAQGTKNKVDESPEVDTNGSAASESGVIYSATVRDKVAMVVVGVRPPLYKKTKISSEQVIGGHVLDVKWKAGKPSKAGNPQDDVLVLITSKDSGGCLSLFASRNLVEVEDSKLESRDNKVEHIFSHTGSNVLKAAATDEGKNWRIIVAIQDKETFDESWWSFTVDRNLVQKSSPIRLSKKQGEGQLEQFGTIGGRGRELAGRAADSPVVLYSFIEIDYSNPGQHPFTLAVGTLDAKGKLDLTTKKLDNTPLGKLGNLGGLDTACAYRVSRDDPESGRMCMGELVLVFHAQSDRCPGFGRRQIYAVTFDPVERKFGKVLEVTQCPRTYDNRLPSIDYSPQTGTFLVAFMSTSLGSTGEIRMRGLRFTDQGLRTTQPPETVLGSSAHSFDVVAFAPPTDNRATPAVSHGDFFVTYVEDGPAKDTLYGNTIDMGCLAGADTLCLNDDDYRVRALYRTKQGESGYAKAVELTDDTGYFWFFDEDNVEVVVKLLTPCRGSGHAWVFAGGLTDVEVELLVEEVATGFVRRYLNRLKTAFQPIQHTKAFPCDKDALVAGVSSEGGLVSADATFDEWRHDLDTLRLGGAIDRGLELGSENAFASPRAKCKANNTTMCLSDDRFQVEATFRTPDGQSGTAMAVELTSDTGYFWFFKKSNVEAVFKIINPCKNQKNFWVFGAGLTDVEVVVTVTDTTNGKKKVYRNPLGKPFRPIQDTAALPCS